MVAVERVSARPLAWLGLPAAVLICLALTGCGGTKVLTAQKTIVYKESIYNVSNVREVRPLRQLVLPDAEVVDMRGMSDGTIRELIREHERVRVRMSVVFDDIVIRYLDGSVKNPADLRRYERRFDQALDRIRKFLADRRKTQLRLD